MPSNKKYTGIILIILAIIVIVGIVWYGHSSSNSTAISFGSASSSTPAVVSETTKVSGSLSEYQNAELGFSVNYPSTWEKEEGNAGVTFIVPIDSSQVSTVATLQGVVQVVSGTCAFPPVTTISDRGTVTAGSNTFDMIAMSNTVQGRVYFNRMYSLQHGDICYIFSFASITLDPSSKGLTGSNVTQAQNNNKAIVDAADGDFTNVVKSFAFISTPPGESETEAAPAKQ